MREDPCEYINDAPLMKKVLNVRDNERRRRGIFEGPGVSPGIDRPLGCKPPERATDLKRPGTSVATLGL